MAIEKSIKKTIKRVLEMTNEALDAARQPAMTVAAFLVYATAVHRPGISKTKITSEIIADNANLGINTGQMPDGTDNVVNQFRVGHAVVGGTPSGCMYSCCWNRRSFRPSY